jgi:hypothetical protein
MILTPCCSATTSAAPRCATATASRIHLGSTVASPAAAASSVLTTTLELDVLAGTSKLHEELVQQMDRLQQATYRTILAAGIEQGVFRPTMTLDTLTLALVAIEDGFTLQIVADRIITHDARAGCHEGRCGQPRMSRAELRSTSSSCSVSVWSRQDR